jgi:NAD(P)H-hydrate epimerase
VERIPDRGFAESGDGSPLEGAAVVLDGILGTGIRGAPRERQAEAIRRVNASGRPVVALDVPSGVDADTGAVPGDAVNAYLTVAFGWPKLGSLLHPARGRVGRLLVFEIGFPPTDASLASARVLTPGWAVHHRPRRISPTHKNEVGSLLVVAGSRGMAGAAVLAGGAALRAGTGLVRIASVDTNRTVLQATLPEAIFVDVADRDALNGALEASSAVAIGPGLGTSEDAERTLARILDGPSRPLLLDADALNLLSAGRPHPVSKVGRGRDVVLTPHPGEMERLSHVSRAEIAVDRAGFARRWSAEHGVTLLLKGSPSLVASPDGPLLVDAVGTSDLATGGMGDVLSGTVGAFLAQGADARTAAGLGLHVSGRSAERARRGVGLLPSDVVDHLPAALREPGPGDSDLDLPGLVFDQDPAR